MHARNGLFNSRAGKDGGRCKTYFITLKSVLAFQTSTAATLGKWATTHERGFFLGKNCFWTLLPGSIWLQTPITWLYPRWKIRTRFASLKRVDDLRVYQGFMMPLNHQAGMQGTLKEHLRASHFFSVRWYFLWCSIDLTCCVHVTITDVNNLFPRFPLYFLFSFDLWARQLRFWGIWFWLRTL